MQLERQNHSSSVEFHLSYIQTFTNVKKCTSTTAVDYRSVIWNCSYCLRLYQFFRLLTEEGGILEPSKILNKEFYRLITKNLLLWIYQRSQIYSTCYINRYIVNICHRGWLIIYYSIKIDKPEREMQKTASRQKMQLGPKLVIFNTSSVSRVSSNYTALHPTLYGANT